MVLRKYFKIFYPEFLGVSRKIDPNNMVHHLTRNRSWVIIFDKSQRKDLLREGFRNLDRESGDVFRERNVFPGLIIFHHRGGCWLPVLDCDKWHCSARGVSFEEQHQNNLPCVMSPILEFPLIYHHFPQSVWSAPYENGIVMPCTLVASGCLFQHHHRP